MAEELVRYGEFEGEFSEEAKAEIHRLAEESCKVISEKEESEIKRSNLKNPN